jgi:lysine-N-methylase
VVNVTDAERQRIVDDGWEARLPGPLFMRYHFGGRTLYRLAHNPDGACVFLDPEGRCRLHAESGRGAKPFACRLYPFVPTPSPSGMRLDLRADCPSVAANRGRSLNVHEGQVSAMAAESGIPAVVATPWWGSQRAAAPAEFDAVADRLVRVLDRRGLTFRARLVAGASLLDDLYEIRFQKLTPEQVVDVLELLCAHVLSEPGDADGQLGARSRRLFGQWLFLHGIADDPEELRHGRLTRLRRSWSRYLQSRRFADLTGPVPRLAPDWPDTTFEELVSVRPAEDAALEPLVRSMRVKLEARAFAGPSYFGADILSGLTALWLLPGVVGWLARLHAVGAGRDMLSAEDVLEGVRRAHHTFGVSPVFTRISERLRLRALSRPGIASGVLRWYGP